MILRFVATAPQRLEKFLCGCHCCPRPVSRAIGSVHVDAPLTFLFVFTCVLVRTVDAWWDYAGLNRMNYTTHKDFCREYS